MLRRFFGFSSRRDLCDAMHGFFRPWSKREAKIRRGKPRCVHLEVVQLEDRLTPSATLYWNGPAGGSWNVPANWNVIENNKVVPSKNAPGNSDILVFTGNANLGKQTSSVDNMDLDLMALQVEVGFGQNIQLAQPLTITGIDAGGNEENSWLLSGSLSGKNLTVEHGTLAWTDATQNGNGNSQTIIEAGAVLSIIPTASATLNNRSLVIQAGASATFQSGTLQLNGNASVVNKGTFSITAVGNAAPAAIATPAGNAATKFDNEGNASLFITLRGGSFAILPKFDQMSTKNVVINNSVLLLEGGGKIAGGFIGTTATTSLQFTTINGAAASPTYTWQKGTAFSGRMTVTIAGGLTGGARVDAVVNVANGVTVPFTILVGLIGDGSTIGGEGTIEIQRNGNATLMNTVLTDKLTMKVDKSGMLVLTQDSARFGAGKFQPSMGGDAKIENAGTVVLKGDANGVVTLGMNGSALITNTGTFDIQDDSGISAPAGSNGKIMNDGIFQKSGGAMTSTVNVTFVNGNNSQLLALSGTLKIPKGKQVGKPSVTKENGGKLNTDGVFDLDAGILENVGPSALDGEVYGNVDNSGGEVAPGGVGGIGVLTIDGVSGDYTQSGSGALDITIAGPDAGTQYSQLVVTGTVTLGGKLNIDAVPNFQGNYFVLINNEGNQAVQGQFDGLPEGTELTLDNRQFIISYKGGDGNDVVLYAVTPQFIPTTTTIDSSENPALEGDPVTFTADVAPSSGTGTPTGPVEFLDGGTVLGVGNLAMVNGVDQASLTISDLTLGNHYIAALYLGDQNYAVSLSPELLQVIGIPTEVTIASLQNPSVTGQNVPLTANVTTSDGTPVSVGNVEFFAAFNDGVNVPLGIVPVNAAGQAQLSVNYLLPPGNEIFADYLGSGQYLVSPSPLLNQMVNAAETSLTLTAASTTVSVGQADAFNTVLAAVSPGAFVYTPTGVIDFYVSFDGGSPSLLGEIPVTGSGTAPSFSAAGTYVVYAVYTSGDGNYNGSTSNSVTITVTNSGSLGSDPPLTLANNFTSAANLADPEVLAALLSQSGNTTS